MVRSRGKSLLIEAGLRGSSIKKALGYRLSEVSGCLISHSHADHSAGILDLVRAGVDCWMTSETAEVIGATGHRVHIVIPKNQFEIDGFKILAFPAEHDVPNVGFLISDGEEKLVYLNDSFYSRYAFKGVSIYAIGCNYSSRTLSPNLDPARKRRLMAAHMSLENCIRFFQAQDLSKCRCIHLLHLSADNSDEEMFKRTIQEIAGKPVFVCEA